jgi:hypothetical protein
MLCYVREELWWRPVVSAPLVGLQTGDAAAVLLQPGSIQCLLAMEGRYLFQQVIRRCCVVVQNG